MKRLFKIFSLVLVVSVYGADIPLPPEEPAVVTPAPSVVAQPAPSQEAMPQEKVAAPAPIPTVPTEVTKKELAQREAKIDAEKKELEMVGIDTIDIEEGGNWLLKRQILEEMIDLIEKSTRLFTKILDARMDYKIKRNQLDSEFDAFLGSIGFDLGDIDELLESLIERMEKERQMEGDLSEEERNLLEIVTRKRNEIKQLQSDLKSLHSAENSLTDVLLTVENQINISNEHQNQAWKNFQLIKKILSDEKAEELYYNTEGLFKSLQEIYTYLTTTLPKYFNDQLQAVRNQMNKIKTAVRSLQDDGIDLKKEAEKIEQAEQSLEKKREAAKEKADIEAALKKAEAERRAKTWWHRWWINIQSFFATLMSPINYVISSIKGLFVKTPPLPPPSAMQPPIKSPTITK